jgi:hypothetical protein
MELAKIKRRYLGGFMTVTRSCGGRGASGGLAGAFKENENNKQKQRGEINAHRIRVITASDLCGDK